MNALEFDGALYPVSAVRRAISDYASIARIAIEETEKGCICRIEASVAPMELTALEFANYVLELSCTEDRTHDSD